MQNNNIDGFTGKRIVVVDDDKDFASSIAAYLNDYKADVTVFNNSTDAFEYISSDSSIDLILLDLQMPKLNGMEFIRKMSENEISTPVVIVSATGDIQDAISTVREGAKDFISKPILNFDELEICIRQVISQSEIEREIQSYRTKLESLVEQRTKELAEINRHLVDEVEKRRLAEDLVKKGSIQIMQALERERNRLSRELHDSVGQKLVLAKMNVELLKKAVGRDNQYVQAALENLNEISLDINSIIKFLYPQAIEKYSLSKNIESIVNSFNSASSIDFSIEISGEETVLDTDCKLNIYRVVQESLNNVIKHSGAAAVTLELEFSNGKITCSIIDDGCGYEIEKSANPKGAGLLTIQERINHLNGEINISSSKNKGTKIYFEVPV